MPIYLGKETDPAKVFEERLKKVLDKTSPLWYNRRDLSDSKYLLSRTGNKKATLVASGFSLTIATQQMSLFRLSLRQFQHLSQVWSRP